MLDKNEKEILWAASTVIWRELVESGEAKIPGFGKFYTTEVKVSGTRFGKDTGEGDKTIKAVRFKPFVQLKEIVNGQREVVVAKELDPNWVQDVGQKMKEGATVTVGDSDGGTTDGNFPETLLEKDCTTFDDVEVHEEEAYIKINDVDVTEQVKDTTIETEDSKGIKTPPKGGGLLGGLGGGSALLGG